MPGNPDARDVAVLLGKLFKRAVAGDLDGVAVSYDSLSEGEGVEVAGKYARDKAAALKACLRQSVAMGLFNAKHASKPPADLIQLRPRRSL